MNYLLTHQWLLILLTIWTIPWKGVALWRAAQNRSAGWFIILLTVNTLAILDILYIFYFSRKKFKLATAKHEIDKVNSFEKKLDIKK